MKNSRLAAILALPLSAGFLLTREYLRQKSVEEKAREIIELEVKKDWENYFNFVCNIGVYDDLWPQGYGNVNICSEGNEKDKILKIIGSEGSVVIDRNVRMLNLPSHLGGDFMAVYAAIPTNGNIKVVQFTEEDCYVIRSDSININERDYETINLEGKLNCCVSEDEKNNLCEKLYGTVIFVQKPEYCDNVGSFQWYIENASDELGLSEWRKLRR